MRSGWLTLIITATLSLSMQAQGAARTLCVFDVVGAYGDSFNMMKSYRLEAMKAGVMLEMKAYRDEPRLIRDFKAGKCDIAGLTDLGVREFNHFTGSISAIGAIPRYEDLQVVMHILASPRLARKLNNGTYSILGVVPLGAMYLYVKDRSIDTVEELAGKGFTVLSRHPDAREMIEYIHARPISAEISNFARFFNNGVADVCYAPASGYDVLELSKGLGRDGGIVHYPLGQFTLQLVAHSGTFDPAFERQSRRIMGDLLETAMRIIYRYERAVPQSRWIELPDQAIRGYQEMIREMRIGKPDATTVDQSLAEAYDPSMMHLLRKIRCYTNPGALECSSHDRE